MKTISINLDAQQKTNQTHKLDVVYNKRVEDAYSITQWLLKVLFVDIKGTPETILESRLTNPTEVTKNLDNTLC